ncbi:MAG: DUF4124 domain-containing protein [Pseudoxanthomonas sp.]
MKLKTLLLALSLCALNASADEVVFYRCTNASGALTLQNMPCPKGDRQEKKVMQGVSTVPMGSAAAPGRARPASAATAAASATAPVAATAPSRPTSEIIPAEPVDSPAALATEVRLSPPVLFQCITHDKDSYITEDEEPKSRCVTMQTVGLDGNPQTGAGEACEMMRDQCARVADGALCEAWKKRVGETEVAWRFARVGNEEKNRIEFERAQKIYRESSCSK